MTRNVAFSPGNFYHIYNRGTEKRDIFLSNQDRNRFLFLLYLCNGTVPVDIKLQGSTLEEISRIDRGNPLVDMCAYCLMPNHFHLLLRENEFGGVSKFMQKLVTGYTMYFNKLQERSGSLFQGRFKATFAKTDSYLSYLVAYIHLNPVKLIEPQWKECGIIDQSNAKKYLEQYRYSSYLDYLGINRVEKIVLNQSSLPEYFEYPRNFKAHTEHWLNYNLQG